MGLEKINEIRKQKKITIENLAQQAGVPVSTIAKICSGRTKDPKLDTLKAIARVLDCSLDDFNDDSGEVIPQNNDTRNDHIPSSADLRQLVLDFYAMTQGDQELLASLAHRLSEGSN
jgi:transcriptional regulator with XRE-family HTH domain